jgi:transketolase
MNYEELLKEIVFRDERFVVMTAENRAVIRGLPAVLGDRFIDTGINEQALIGTAVGMALRGRIPVVHALAAFLTMRAFEFIRTDIGIANLPIKLVGFVPGFLSEANGPTHQAIEDVALMRVIPTMKIFCPADEAELLLGLPEILQVPYPVYIRLNLRKSWFRHNKTFETGKAEVISKGTDITLLVYGILFTEALEAKELLEDRGYSVGLINLRTLVPFDEDAVMEAVSESRCIATIEDHRVPGGLYSILGEIFLKHRIMRPVLSIGLQKRWFTPTLLRDLLIHEGFTGEGIARKIMTLYPRRSSTVTNRGIVKPFMKENNKISHRVQKGG